MKANALTKVTSTDVSDDEAHSAAIQAVHDALLNTDLAIYGKVPDEFSPTEAFYSRSPHRALTWICRNMNPGKLLKTIQAIYDNPVEETHVEDVVDLECELGTAEISGSDSNQQDPDNTVGRKRKRSPREKTTREVNKALVDKMNIALAHTAANGRDWELAKAPVALSDEQQNYRDFARSFPGAGVEAVAQMIANAEAVGSREAFEDWQAIMGSWRRQRSEAKKQFRRVIEARTSLAAQAYDPEDHDNRMTASQLVLSQRHNPNQVDDMGLTVLQREMFRYRLVDAQKSRIDGFAEEMRQRWKLDALYVESEKLETGIRRMAKGTAARGVRYSTVAKDHLFRIAFESDDGYVPSKKDNPDLYKHFSDLLDWGKKWNIVKKRFGSAGIFGLLPKSIGANVRLERLTQARVRQWIEMVAHCNVDVAEIAPYIEPLFMAFVEDRAPPEEFWFLEQFEGFHSTRPLALFQRYCLAILLYYGYS